MIKIACNEANPTFLSFGAVMKRVLYYFLDPKGWEGKGRKEGKREGSSKTGREGGKDIFLGGFLPTSLPNSCKSEDFIYVFF